jgi:hypothetical protein
VEVTVNLEEALKNLLRLTRLGTVGVARERCCG